MVETSEDLHGKANVRTYRSWPPRTVVTCSCGKVLEENTGLNAIMSKKEVRALLFTHRLELLFTSPKVSFDDIINPPKDDKQ